MEPVTDFGWVAVAVAPWAVSPHPNFGVETLQPYNIVGLITEFRHYELEKQSAKLHPGSPGWAEHALRCLTDSTIMSRQLAASNELTELSLNAEISPGARATCALYAAVAYAEMDDLEAAATTLSNLLLDLSKGSHSSENLSGSYRLILSLLHLQAAVRFYEMDSLEAAASELRMLQGIAPTQKTSSYETFEVSQGIRWSPRRVQLDILQKVRSNAVRLKSKMESYSGESWVQVLRSRPGWIDIRTDWSSAKRDRQFVFDALESRAQSSSTRQRLISRDTGMDAGLSSLFVSELSGDIGRIYRNRAELGRVRVVHSPLDSNGDSSRIDALRLLRHARDKESLSSALILGRSEWDAEILRISAHGIIRQSSFPQRISDVDLQLLSSAVDVLSVKDLESVLTAVWTYLALSRGHRLHSFSGEEHCFKIIRQSLTTLTEHNQVADRILTWVRDAEFVQFSQASAVEGIVSRLNAESIAASTRSAWLDWAQNVSPRSKELQPLVRAVLRKMGSLDLISVAPGLDDTELALEILYTGSTLQDVDRSTLQRVVSSSSQALSQLREQARHPVRTIGGVDHGDLAVSLAIQLASDELWLAVEEFVLDSAVSGNVKAGAIERITHNIETVPPSVLDRLRDEWSSFAKSIRTAGTYDDKQFRHFPEALRFAGKSGAFPVSALLEAVTDLSGDPSSQSRIEAAKSVRYLDIARESTEWAVSLLLQLSRDTDSVVRAEAGQSLAALSHIKSRIATLAGRRLLEMLEEPSIRTPLAVIHGLQMRAAGGNVNESDIALGLRRVSTHHPSIIVREAALLALPPQVEP